MALGALAGTLGSFLTAYQNVVNLVCGLIIFFYGVKLGWSFVELWQSVF